MRSIERRLRKLEERLSIDLDRKNVPQLVHCMGPIDKPNSYYLVDGKKIYPDSPGYEEAEREYQKFYRNYKGPVSIKFIGHPKGLDPDLI